LTPSFSLWVFSSCNFISLQFTWNCCNSVFKLKFSFYEMSISLFTSSIVFWSNWNGFVWQISKFKFECWKRLDQLKIKKCFSTLFYHSFEKQFWRIYHQK
jgi:hypothetical protein